MRISINLACNQKGMFDMCIDEIFTELKNGLLKDWPFQALMGEQVFDGAL